LKFYLIKDAKSLWEAIQIRFGGNKESKKMYKIILKQQNKNFVASRSEGLDKTYDSINETVTTAHDNPAAGSKEQLFASSYADDVMFSVFARQSYTLDLKNQLEETMKEKDDLKENLTKFEESSKNLTKLINSQMSANDKTGLRYDSQLKENEMPKCEIFKTASDSNVSEIDEDNNQAKDRYKVRIGYHAVPPPYIGNYMPLRADLSFAGLDDYVFKFKISETRTSVNKNESITSKSSEEIREEPKTVRNFDPTTVATKSGQVLVNAAKQNSAVSTSTTRPNVNTAAIRPNVNAKYSYFKPHFPKMMHFNQRSAAKTNTFSRKINTAKGKNVTTAGPKAVVNAAEGKKENAVKSSAC
nr:hypothetical protein [Tanacetum cinerariifolium]